MPELQFERDLVFRELEKVLSHPYFEKATLQANVLRHMVTWTVEGEDFDGHKLGYKLIPQYDKGTSSDIRKAKKFLLEWLADYYKGEGKENELLIRLNKEGYGLTIASNLSATFYKQMRLARQYLSQYSPLRLREALSAVDESFAPEGNIEFTLFQCETGLMMSCFPQFFDPESLRKNVRLLGAIVPAVNPTCYGLLVLGAARLLAGYPSDAHDVFTEAMQIDAAAVKRYGWYWATLITLDRLPEAIELITVYCDENPADSFKIAVLGMAWYLVRDYTTAQTYAKRAVDMDHNCWFGHLISGLTHHALGESEPAAFSYMMLQRAISMPGFDFFPGLLVLFTAEDAAARDNIGGVLQHVLKKLIEPPQDEKYDDINASVAFASLAPMPSAKLFAARCDTYGFPPWHWAHLWPFLDPLRKEPDFQVAVAVDRAGTFISSSWGPRGNGE